ncbi:MAG: NUDIX hydrolase [Chloroflexota bacterium]
MYFTETMVWQAEKCFGVPKTIRLNYPTPQVNFDFIRSTQKNDRAHDITLYFYHDQRLAVTRKPMYPKGAYRPSSGGLNPGETLEQAAAREGWEEMGVTVTIRDYLLRARVDFIFRDDRIRWTTHVFRVVWEGTGEPTLKPQDTREICEAVWATEAEFLGPMQHALLSTDSTGLLYRTHLHDYIWRTFGWG